MSISCNSLKSTESNGSLEFANQNATQWRDIINTKFTEYDTKNTTILFGGMTILHNRLVIATLKSAKENFIALPDPDFESFAVGKAYGNKAQCNPTYFTVGNLVKYLQNLRDKEGLSSEEIVKKYVYVTASGCGPCRFGMYITEYRKALADAGFAGFRVLSFEHNRLVESEEDTFKFTIRFFVTIAKATVVGDILNMIKYKMRPYEIESGSVDRALEECYTILEDTLARKKSIIPALLRCKKILRSVKLNRLQPKPKVMVIGEFWAAMTEGDGSYRLQEFLEQEGAEVIPQPITHRLMLSIWENEYFNDREADLADDTHFSWIDFKSSKTKIGLFITRVLFKLHFYAYAKSIGLIEYKLPDIKALAKMSQEYYPLDADGGEGHMEVSHLLENIKHKLAHMVISVKPFGCMPSSAVSDGIQSLITARYPEANFLSVETSGEGAANFYSRVQMALFKAKQAAKDEYNAIKKPDHIPNIVHRYDYEPKSHLTGTAAKILDELQRSKI